MASPKTVRSAIVFLAALGVASCTLLGARDIVQCRADSDCPSVRPSCSDGLCAPRASATTDGGADANDTPEAAAECKKTDDCAQTDPTLCVAGRCKVLKGGPCPVLLPADQKYREDGAIVVGVYLHDPISSYATGVIQFALEEINLAIQSPRIVALLCTKPPALDAQKTDAVLEHLAALQVPLVMGQFETSELGSMVASAKQKNIAVWSTLGNDTTLQPPALPSNDLYRFFLDEPRSSKLAFQRALDHAVTRAGELPGADLSGGVRVAMLASKTVESLRVADTLTAPGGITVGGVSIGSLGESRFFRQNIDPRYEVPSTDYKKYILPLGPSGTFHPHVVIGIGGDEIVQRVIGPLDKDWGASTRPVYVLSSRSKYELVDLIKLGSNDLGRERVFGVDFSGDGAKHASFFSAAKLGGLTFHAASYDVFYDATYAVALAAIAADRARSEPLVPISAAALAKGLDMLAPAGAGATVVGQGTNAFRTAVDLLRQGKPVHFVGATGPWTFDKARSSRTMGSSLYCFKPGSSELNYYLDPTSPIDAGACSTP